MQSCIRERRSIKGIRGSRVCKAAGLALILSSCASTQVSTPNSKEASFASKVCLNSTGRGRITIGKEVKRFTYQAQIKEESFILGIDIPFKGQESLVLPLKGRDLKGSLYKKVSAKLLKSRKLNTSKVFDEFLLRSAALFSSIKNIKEGSCKQGKCLSGALSESSDRVIYSEPWSKNYKLLVNFERFSKGHYRHMKVKAYSISKKKSPLSLDLVVDECQ
ncbi:MAG: hypothetical protein BM556_03980 [Bacteriovorax sp. MedPE-SWde]|nr:MAG: hypothetical protein BM556_03980 [Bacteriovorax sp. MedPE-SWde]